MRASRRYRRTAVQSVVALPPKTFDFAIAYLIMYIEVFR